MAKGRWRDTDLTARVALIVQPPVYQNSLKSCTDSIRAELFKECLIGHILEQTRKMRVQSGHSPGGLRY
jgi:hypothetical protein